MKKDGYLPRRVRISTVSQEYIQDTLLESRLLLEKPVTAQDEFQNDGWHKYHLKAVTKL